MSAQIPNAVVVNTEEIIFFFDARLYILFLQNEVGNHRRVVGVVLGGG